VWPVFADARSASLRENRLSRRLRAFLRKAIRAGLAPPGGAGSARPQGWLGPNRYMSPQGPRVIFDACGGNEMPGLGSGPYLRTHGVRPSEKTALRVMPGFSPLGHPGLDCPPLEGRAPHARKDGLGLTDTCPHKVPGSSLRHVVEMRCPGLHTARICGRTECVPPRKPPSALCQGFRR
jgi:hypothetical protein